MKKNISLVIADDHEIFRDGLVLLLNKQENMSLVGQATNGRELVQLVADKKPDVVLTDIKMPYMDGIAACRLMLQQDPTLRIIALSMFEEEDLIVEMLEAGAKGYLLKGTMWTELPGAIREVLAGGVYLSPRAV